MKLSLICHTKSILDFLGTERVDWPKLTSFKASASYKTLGTG